MLIGRDKFIEIAKEIPFIADELRKANPRFTLEWSNGNSRFKYVVIQTMFDIYRIMAEKTEAQEKEIRKYESKITEFEKAKINDEVLSELSEAQKEPIKLYPVKKIYMDRWAPSPEFCGSLYFKSEFDRTRFLESVNRERRNSVTVPDEYMSYERQTVGGMEMNEDIVNKMTKCSYITPKFTLHYYE